jgi:hypothetical protein
MEPKSDWDLDEESIGIEISYSESTGGPKLTHGVSYNLVEG